MKTAKLHFSIKKSLFLSLISLFTFLYFIVAPKSVAAEYYFHDEFNSQDLDSSTWEIYLGNGSYTVNNGKLLIECPSGKNFPYIYTKNDVFPEDNYIFEVKFRYPSVSYFGTGIVLQAYVTSYPDPPEEEISEHLAELGLIASWQDRGLIDHKIEKRNCVDCSNPSTILKTIPAPDTQDHILTVIKTGNTQKIILKTILEEEVLEEVLYEGEPYSIRPKYIRFGNNYTLGEPHPWTSIEIDYVRVKNIYPLIILPGMMACWNNAIITGGEGNEWNLWSIPYNAIYKPLLENLQKANLEENEDYYVFCYDWRKPVDHNKEKLSSFIQNNFPSEDKVDLVGHSMGGLIARSYTQSYPTKVNKLITVGSPHKGAAESYFAWEGGVILDDNLLTKFAKRLIIFLNNPLEQVPFRTIRAKITSLKDLLPTYNFLVDMNDPSNIKQISDHLQKNDYFMELNDALQDEVKEKTSIIYGSDFDTLDQIKATTLHPHANWLHYAVGMWEDGEPVSQIIEDKYERDYSPSFLPADGDKTVTVSSANIEGVDSYEILGDHSQIINSPDGVFKIFNLLGLDFPPENISVSPIGRILALVLHSPVNFLLTNQSDQQVGFQAQGDPIPDSFYDESVKTIILLNPEDNLTLTVLGENGSASDNFYEISFLELDGQNEVTAYRFAGRIGASQPEKFLLDLSKDHLFVHEGNQEAIFNSFLNKIDQAKNFLDGWGDLNPQKGRLIKRALDKVITRAQNYKDNYNKANYRKATLNLILARRYLFRIRRLINNFGKDNPPALMINEYLFSAFSELNYLYLDAQEKRELRYSPKRLELNLKITKKILDRRNQKMQRLKDSKKEIYQYQGIAFLKAQDYYIKAQKALSEGENTKALLYSTLSRWFLFEVN